MPYENRGGDWSDASASQEMTRILAVTESQENGIEQILLWCPWKEQLCQ